MGRLLLVIAALPLLLVACFVTLVVVAADLLGQALGQPAVTAWLLDTPQPTWMDLHGAPGSPGAGPVFGGGQVGVDGYSGPARFVCQLPVAQGYLTDRYGVARDPYPAHSGIDYGTCYRENLAVYSPMSGKVVYAGWSASGYGNLIVIENQGWQVYLAHNNDFLVPVGALVEAGQAVARSGSTGRSSGPHVHLETRECQDGSCLPRDPNRVWLPGQTAVCDWYALSVPCAALPWRAAAVPARQFKKRSRKSGPDNVRA